MGKLNARQVDSIKTPGRHPDGSGLYLHIRVSGSKAWVLRTSFRGKHIDLGLGPVHALTLADAREKARSWRAMIWAGQHPREIERRDDMTLRTAAAEFQRAHAASWSEGHAARWWSQLDQHILARLGDRHLVDISASDLVQVLGPIWADKHDTARRLLQRLVEVYESAIAGGTYEGSNPTVGLRRALPRVRAETERFGAMV